MTERLTPYDTGEFLEPAPWLVSMSAPGDWGKVDFDNVNGVTEFTIQVHVEIRDGRREVQRIEITRHNDSEYEIYVDGEKQ